MTWPTHPHKAHPTCMHLPTLPPLLAKNAHVLNVDVESKSGFGSVITTGKDMLKILDESWTNLGRIFWKVQLKDDEAISVSDWLNLWNEMIQNATKEHDNQRKYTHTHKAHNDNAHSCITGIWYLHHWKKGATKHTCTQLTIIPYYKVDTMIHVNSINLQIASNQHSSAWPGTAKLKSPQSHS